MTIVIPTSPIPSHPSIEVLMNTINKLYDYEELRECKIIVMVDGVHPKLENRRESYLKYINTLFEVFDADTNVSINLFATHTHQAEMLRQTLPLCDDVIFYVEHDTYIQGEIDIAGCIDLVKHSSVVNQLRFHIFHEFSPSLIAFNFSIMDSASLMMRSINSLQLGISFIRPDP